MDRAIIPASIEDRKKMKTMLSEMTHCMQRADDEKESMKDIASEIFRQYAIPKKTINKLAKTMFKSNYADLQAENEDFELLYETLVEMKTTLSEVG